jgi:predicted molibdopterin-dependent oxidoreductase YjgC
MAQALTTITITIDGKEVQTTPGTMVIQAANDAGIYIPFLCYHPGMKPYGACRMCVVEVEGGRGTPAACTLPANDGMVINTKPAAAIAVRWTCCCRSTPTVALHAIGLISVVRRTSAFGTWM